MTYFVVDVEADGPIPGDYSMIALGAAVVKRGEKRTFLGYLKPISDIWVPEALAVSGFSREETLEFPDPTTTMSAFTAWVKQNSDGNPMFWSDNNGFDWMFVCWYLHHFLEENVFGFSSKNINSLYQGGARNVRERWKHLRDTKHDHNPANDAKGNAEALIKIIDMFEIKGTKI